MGAPDTNFGGKILLGPTFIDVSDDIVEFVWEDETTTPSVSVYGPSQTRTATGTTKWSGHFKVVYDYMGGTSKAYRVLLGEKTTPTAGGLYVIYKPTGEGAGEEQETGYVILGNLKYDDRGAEAIQTRTFEFVVNGQVSKAAQTT